ncbi:acetyl-CoA synthetase-like protein [Macrolepiota fuliginosa MF-IS2]|uniref:Acetyl-CoA synthetase-like protein n=1 Tax=Macrolepiota fuliginosa MF-IS2 TaxID=1400762 RepID=A0A9P6C0Z6_9AGAR|nr:acetyl-CoA synthetase-like protein [Macrolepiota fuliginosa MF-IS2]
MYHISRAGLRTRASLRLLSTNSIPTSSYGTASATTPLTHSSVSGPTDPHLSTKTLPQYFTEDVLAHYAVRPALICRKETARAHGGPPARNFKDAPYLAWDFQEFDRHIRALARGLLILGVKRGDRVGVVMGNNSAYAMLQWACASIGVILVTINPAYQLQELVNTLRLVNVQHLFAVPRIRTSTYVETLSQAFPQIRSQQPGEIQIEELPELRNLIVVDNAEEDKERLGRLKIKSLIDWRDILLWGEGGSEERRVKEIGGLLKNDDVINLQFTSGTTGLPKAVSLTHSNLLNNGINIGRCMWFTAQDVLCNVPPLFHCFGLVLGNLAAWTHGACIVYPSEIFDPPSIVDAVAEEKCTALHGVPTHFLGVLAEVEKRRAEGATIDFRRLRTGIAAGSPIPIDLMKNLIEKLNLRDLTVAYGMTETSPVSFQSTPADPVIKRVETVGKIHPHVKAKVVGVDGKPVPVGTPGEVMVSGYLLQKGYWNDEGQTKKIMKEGEEGAVWLSTGDEGIMDEEGYLKIVGRIKDIIIRGGENLFPVQIENALTAQDPIREASVVAVPDEKYGEVVGAWIVREPGSSISKEEVRKAVTQGMNPQNAPAWVWFIGEDGNPPELPKTASGKVQKHILRKWSQELAKRGVGEVQVARS